MYQAFLSHLRERNMADETIIDYGNTYRRFFTKYELIEADIKAFLAPHQPRTRKKYRDQLKSLAKYARVDMDWDRNIPQPKFKEKSPLTLSKADQEKLVKYLTWIGTRHAAILLLLIHTGLRVNELSLITKDSVMEVETQDGTKRKLLRIDPQGSHSKEGRYVPLDSIAQEQLEILGLPFAFDRRAFNAFIVDARRRLNLPCYKIHSLRKTFMTRSLARGVNVIDLANIMGHSSVQTMLSYASKDAQTLTESFFHGTN